MGSISDFGTGYAAPTGGSAGSTAPRLVAIALLAATLAPVLLGAAAPATNLDISVTGLRSAKGMIRVCLTADPANFPGCVDDRHAITRSVPANQSDIRILGLAAGNYAAAVIHDENSNARLDTFAGIPREGFGFSRNPRIGFGPPRFSSAMFAVGGVAETQQVTMRYLF